MARFLQKGAGPSSFLGPAAVSRLVTKAGSIRVRTGRYLLNPRRPHDRHRPRRFVPDSQPTRPTSQWVPGEIVTDTYTLPVPAGEYTLSVGLYLQENGLRLPVNDANGSALGDEIALHRE